MTIPYFFINKSAITNNKIIIDKSDSNYKHLVTVLRVKKGEKIIFSDNKSFKYFGLIDKIQGNSLEIIINKKIPLVKNIPKISLYQCLIKKEAMELVIQKTAEIGVEDITPVFSKRSVVIINKNEILKKINRWQLIAINASMQCKRDFICNINMPKNINLVDVSSYDIFFILTEEIYFGMNKIKVKKTSGNKNNKNLDIFFNIFNKNFKSIKKVGFITGPEGGFEENEVKDLIRKGAVPFNFTNNILRSETASIYFLSVIDFLFQYYERL